mgnify:FL=1
MDDDDRVLERDAPEPVDDSFAQQSVEQQEKRDLDLDSAIKKLAKFGLTEDEVRALAGLTQWTP